MSNNVEPDLVQPLW